MLHALTVKTLFLRGINKRIQRRSLDLWHVIYHAKITGVTIKNISRSQSLF